MTARLGVRTFHVREAHVVNLLRGLAVVAKSSARVDHGAAPGEGRVVAAGFVEVSLCGVCMAHTCGVCVGGRREEEEGAWPSMFGRPGETSLAATGRPDRYTDRQTP